MSPWISPTLSIWILSKAIGKDEPALDKNHCVLDDGQCNTIIITNPGQEINLYIQHTSGLMVSLVCWNNTWDSSDPSISIPDYNAFVLFLSFFMHLMKLSLKCPWPKVFRVSVLLYESMNTWSSCFNPQT